MTEISQHHVKDTISLDSIDLRIIRLLYRNCRTPYREISAKIGISLNATRSRINRLVSLKIIQRFLTIPNPVIFEYDSEYFFIIKYPKSNIIKPEEIMRKLNLMGETLVYAKSMGATYIFYMLVKKGAERKIDVIADLLNPAVVEYKFTILEPATMKLTNSDFKIIKCLVGDPRMGIKDISINTSISSRTISKRIERMLRNQILFFSLITDMSVLPLTGYIEFVLIISIERDFYYYISERIYDDLDEYLVDIFNSNKKDIVFANFFCSNIAVMDKIVTNVESYHGVKSIELFIISKISYYENWFVEELTKY